MFLNSGYGGDGSNPYPGSAKNRSFTPNSLPNSDSYSGQDSFVCISHISNCAPSMTMNVSVDKPLKSSNVFAPMTYNNKGGQYQRLPDNQYLQPTPYAPTGSRLSGQYDHYQPNEPAEFTRLERGSNTTHRMHVFRCIASAFAVLFSIAVVIPMSMTLIEYLRTRNATYSRANDGAKSVWPANVNMAYTYVYLGVSVGSLLLNAIVLLMSCHSVRQAKGAPLAATRSSIIMFAHALIWAAAVAGYRYGKREVQHKWEDLWGWTCSGEADDVQPYVKDIDFRKYCNIQVRYPTPWHFEHQLKMI